MLKTLPSKNYASQNNLKSQPKDETLFAILNFSRSLEVKKIKNKAVFINNN
jgi:hypothetical protein